MRVGLSGLLLAGVIALGAVVLTSPAIHDTGSQPNVIVVMTDDQDLASMAAMPKVNKRVGEAGATFDEALVNKPLCCPSRATFLTGQYPHNNGVIRNNPPNGGVTALDSSNALPVWLQAAGYHTTMIGKYLNGYEFGPETVPHGWSEWHGMRDPVYAYYAYKLFEDGVVNQYGLPSDSPDNPSDPAMYNTDVLTDKAVRLVSERAPREQPFFLWLTYLAPHGGGPRNEPASCKGSTPPAPRHLGDLKGQPMLAAPSVNERDVSDKPPIVRREPRLSASEVAKQAALRRCHRESLLAVDEGVGEILNELQASGELGNTLVIFTSDNGYLFGEHRYFRAKQHPYEEALRVPLMMRGPGIPAGTVVSEPAINIDLAPTILKATGASAGVTQDGRALQRQILNTGRRLGRDVLTRGGGWYGVRNERFSYVERNEAVGGGVELYDLRRDPFQLESADGKRRYREAQQALHARLRELKGCAGRECSARPRLKLIAGRPRCDGDRARVLVRGAEAEVVASVRFVAGGADARVDRRPPFEVNAAASGNATKARAKLTDGRIFDLVPVALPTC